MRFYLSFLIVLMLAYANCSPARSDQSRQQTAHQTEDGPTLSLGMSHELALQIIRECGGQDITSRLGLAGPHGEGPFSGIYWDLEQYNSVLEIAAKDGKVVGIGYWTLADFSESKVHRLQSKRSLKSLTFDKQTKTLKILSDQ